MVTESNVTIDEGTGTNIDSVQIDGTDEVQCVNPRPVVARIKVSSAGLTTASTAYSADDQLGTELTFANAARFSGGSGIIQSATLLDDAAIVGTVDLYLFDQTVTPASDNAAAAFSDADMQNCLGIITFPPPTTDANNGISTVNVSGLAYVCNGTSLFGSLVTRSGHTFFGAVDDLTVSLVVAKD